MTDPTPESLDAGKLAEAPGHTDLMVAPESIGPWLDRIAELERERLVEIIRRAGLDIYKGNASAHHTVYMAAPSIADAILAAGPEQPDDAPVAGWKMVPVEPTREMWAAAGDAVVNLRSLHHDALSEAVWKAMLRAAPPPDRPVAPSEEGGA